MHNWRRPLKMLRKLLGRRTRAPRPVPLAPGEVAGSQSHLQTLLSWRPPFKAPGEGQILAAEEGKVALAVEGCMAVPGGAVAVRGWLCDPHGQIAGLWVEIDGTFRRASFASRVYRQDVLEQRGLIDAFPGYRTGWHLFETCDVKPGRDVVVNLHAVVQTPEGCFVVSSGSTVAPGHQCSLERLSNDFAAGRAGATTIAAAAQPILRGLAALRHMAWRERRVEATSGEPADLAVVIVVKDNFDMLHHVLAALEACANAGKMEVILSLQSPDIASAVGQCVRVWRGGSFFASIKTLVPVGPIGFGLAASGGIDFAQSPAVAIASDEILPPNGRWLGAALELLSQEPQKVLIPTIATFDHRPFTFSSIFDLAWAGFEHDHSALHDLAEFEPVRDCLAWSCGFLIARRDLIGAAGGLDDSLSEMDICLMDLVLRMQIDGVARLTTLPGSFTHLRLPAYVAGDPTQRLWSLYALAATIRQRCGEAKPREQRQPAASEPHSQTSLSPA